MAPSPCLPRFRVERQVRSTAGLGDEEQDAGATVVSRRWDRGRRAFTGSDFTTPAAAAARAAAPLPRRP